MNKILLFIYIFLYSSVAKSQTVDFTYSTSSGLFCNPTTVQFTQTATGSPTGFVWFFGNGSGSNQSNPLVTFNNAGSYNVKLIVIYGQTTVVVTKTIVIHPSITATIGYDRNYICKPGSINFTASSSGNINAYKWDFGDGSGSTTNTNTITHNFSAFGTFDVRILATDLSGCFDSANTVITVHPPVITGTASPTSGCVPANVSFNANAILPAGGTVINYSWNFGDGSPTVTTNTNSANHTYTLAGNYSPTVSISTSEGCTSSYNFGGVGFGIPPTNQVAYAVKTVICGSEAAQFVAKATNANVYYYNFFDGGILYDSDTTAQHKFGTLGVKSVYILPIYNGCYSGPITVSLNVVGVISYYHYSNTCADNKTFFFKNRSQGNLSTVVWDFGDGSPVVNTLDATHTFPSTGSFITKLTVTDAATGCTDSYSQTIYTSTPALVNQDSSICRNSVTTFSVIHNNYNPLDSFTWHVAGQIAGPFADSTFTTTANLHGNFNNFVVINNGAQYCLDTIRLNHPLLVRGPDLSFTAPASLCLNNLYQVNNTSKPFVPSDSVLVWDWNFGTDSVNVNTYQPPPFAYKNPATYSVRLTSIDNTGCKDTLTDSVAVHPLPFLYAIPNIDTLCSGKSGILTAFHSDNITWAPANSLNCSTCDTVITNASANTIYLITATSQFGCTTKDSVMVKVYPPFTAVAASTDIYICLNDTARLHVDPPGKRIVWSPAAGLSDPNNYGPIVSPGQTTTYTATLTDSVGCFTSSVSIIVHLKSLPTVNAGPEQFYPFDSPFTITPKYSNNVSSYNWTPGNLLNCTTCPDPSGVALKSNTFYIEVTSDSGCVAKDSIKISVECKDTYLRMPTAFTPNHDNLNDYFYPLTIGIQSIIRFSVYDRFGNLVFEAKNFPPNDQTYGWDGTIKRADQSTGVFVYYVEALCDSGEKLYKKGSVVLIR